MSEFDNPEIFKTILETLPTGVYLVDRNRRILFWNAGAETISGYLRQDVVGRFLRDHLLATTDEVLDANSDPFDPLSLAFRDGKSSTGSVSILHKEGYRVPIVLRTVPIRNERGGIIGAAECFEKNISASDRTRRKTAFAELECLDAVTGVPARTFMETRLREHLTIYSERDTPFSILLLQVDQLDQYRAARGPGVVPTILRVVAQTIENSLRPTDLVGCWSESMFVALLLECKETEIESVANRIRKIIGQSEVEWWGDKFSVTAAFGGAGTRPGDTLELLVGRAEKSLMESITAGGNCIIVGT
jgi:diguanylate cyclase (GGDEF)-like protein/PAS domain S-box-containing protein